MCDEMRFQVNIISIENKQKCRLAQHANPISNIAAAAFSDDYSHGILQQALSSLPIPNITTYIDPSVMLLVHGNDEGSIPSSCSSI